MPTKLLDGKVIIVTGASAGIGKAVSLKLGSEGARVVLAARNAEKLKAVAEEIDGLPVPTDISDEGDALRLIDLAFASFGRIDVLINNAAMIRMSRGDSLLPAVMRESFDTNVIGPVVATNRAIHYMRKQKSGGQIINVGSPGFMIGLPFLAYYASTKAAMQGWTRSIQSEWEGSNIRVTEYLPGYISTETIADSEFGRLGQDVFDDPEQSAILKILARPKTPESVADGIMQCILKPKRVAYSGFSVRVGVFLSILSFFRKNIGKRMADTFRKRLKISMFSD